MPAPSAARQAHDDVLRRSHPTRAQRDADELRRIEAREAAGIPMLGDEVRARRIRARQVERDFSR